MDIYTIIEFLSIDCVQDVSNNTFYFMIFCCIIIILFTIFLAVFDKCKTENGKCSHICSYNYTILDFVCSCPSNLMLSANMKDCKRISKYIL